jgi:DNA-binding response OmpR family regulator
LFTSEKQKLYTIAIMELKKQVKELGADGFFAKPFNAVELLSKIKELICE